MSAPSAYQFHNEGFFGYGEPGDFVPFSFWHFVPLAVIANHRIPNANFMYLGNYVPGSELTVDPLSFLPDAQLPRYLITMAIVIALFHLAYLIWKTAARIAEAKQTEAKTGG